MKKHFLILVYFCSLFEIKHAFAQLYSSNNGFVSFFSKTPVKDIYAESKTVSVVLKTSSNEIALRINNTSFKFDNSLMEEHFNEKYMESNKYVASTFAGKINEKIDYKKSAINNISVTGKFLIHGVEKTKTLLGKMNIEGDTIKINGTFKVLLDDFKITKPSIVFKEIADELEINVSLILAKKK